MTTLDAFLRSRAAILALAVIVLGMMSVSSAQAAPVGQYNLCAQSPSGPGCVFTATATVNVVPVGATDDDPADDDPALPLNLAVSPTSVGGVTVTGTFGLTADLDGLNLYSVELMLTGPTTGIPLGAPAIVGLVDFTADPGDVGGILGTLTQFGFTQNGVPYSLSVATGIGVNHGVGSTLFVPLDPTAPVTDWTMIFDINWLGNEGSTLAIDFPLTENPAPEPVSVLLVGSGIGLLALLRRRRSA